MNSLKPILFFPLFLLLASSLAYADVYPFEEDYSEKKVFSFVNNSKAEEAKEEKVAPKVVAAEAQEEDVAERPSRRSDYYKYRTITYKNFGTIMLNLAMGVGEMYRGLFTEAFPSYGSDLASIPAGTAELTGKMVEMERQAFFEANTKQKEIDAYRESVEKPLTPEEQQLLEQLRAKK
jgi:hypothetical protein